MATTFKRDLPEVPDDEWGVETIRSGSVEPDDDVRAAGWSIHEITAQTAEEAELRVLAYIDRHGEDQLGEAFAEAEPEMVGHFRWNVKVTVPDPR